MPLMAAHILRAIRTRGASMKTLRVLMLLIAASGMAGAEGAEPRSLAAVRFLVGSWQGEAQGEPGKRHRRAQL